MYNDYWMADNGFIEKERKGKLTDIISRNHSEKSVITVKGGDTVLQAYAKMKQYDISQLPVMEGDKVVGIIDEYDILTAVESGEGGNFKGLVKDHMTSEIETLKPDDDIKNLISTLKKGYTAIIADENKFYGLITKIDYINYIRLKTNR